MHDLCTAGKLWAHLTSTVNVIMLSPKTPPWLAGPEQDMFWHKVQNTDTVLYQSYRSSQDLHQITTSHALSEGCTLNNLSPLKHSKHSNSSPKNVIRIKQKQPETHHNFWNPSVWTLQSLPQNTQYQPQTASERSARTSLWQGLKVSSSSYTSSRGISHQLYCQRNESPMPSQLHFLLPVVPELLMEVDLLLPLEKKA